jgi:hypothetical protein
LPKDVIERIVDVLRLNVHASERTIVETTLAALRKQDAQTDEERVEELLDAYRANGLAASAWTIRAQPSRSGKWTK